jgi:hypothetical protein
MKRIAVLIISLCILGCSEDEPKPNPIEGIYDYSLSYTKTRTDGSTYNEEVWLIVNVVKENGSFRAALLSLHYSNLSGGEDPTVTLTGVDENSIDVMSIQWQQTPDRLLKVKITGITNRQDGETFAPAFSSIEISLNNIVEYSGPAKVDNRSELYFSRLE